MTSIAREFDDARAFIKAIDAISFDDLMGLQASMDDPAFVVADAVAGRIRERCPAAIDLSAKAGAAVIARIWRHENATFDHPETHAMFWGPINVAIITTEAIAARAVLASDSYAALTAPWRQALGGLPGDDRR